MKNKKTNLVFLILTVTMLVAGNLTCYSLNGRILRPMTNIVLLAVVSMNAYRYFSHRD